MRARPLLPQHVWIAKNPTVILVTHDLKEAVYLADRVLIMSAHPGRIIAERTVPYGRRRSRRRRRRRLEHALPWLVILGMFLAWEAAVAIFRIEPFILPAPTLIAFNSVPKVAVVPILVIWFGSGFWPAVLRA